MPQTQNVHQYSDVRAVLDAATSAGGAVYRLPTKAAATRWRFRAYFYCKLLRDLEQERLGNVPGHRPASPYDEWRFSVVNQGTEKKPDWTVEITRRGPTGALTGLDGRALAIESPVTVPEDRLIEEMDKLSLPEVPE